MALVGHDWGGLIGLRWACDHPDAVWAVVASDTGFFADGRWHGMADALRTPGQGEQLVDGDDARGLHRHARLDLEAGSAPSDAREYFKAFADEPRRRGQLELYRSGEFSELEAYDGKLAALGVPFLALWGEDDPFAPVAGAQRFAREVPGARVQVIPGTGHFVYEDAPETAAAGARRVPGRVRAAMMHVRELGEGPPVLLLHPGPGPRRHGLPARRRAARRAATACCSPTCPATATRRTATATSGRWRASRAPSSGSRRTSSCEDWTLLGHSFGGFVALQHLVDFPGSAARIVASCTDASETPPPGRARGPAGGPHRRAARAGRGGRGARAGRELAAAAQGRLAASRRRG